jgi:glutamate racemase
MGLHGHAGSQGAWVTKDFPGVHVERVGLFDSGIGGLTVVQSIIHEVTRAKAAPTTWSTISSSISSTTWSTISSTSLSTIWPNEAPDGQPKTLPVDSLSSRPSPLTDPCEKRATETQERPWPLDHCPLEHCSTKHHPADHSHPDHYPTKHCPLKHYPPPKNDQQGTDKREHASANDQAAPLVRADPPCGLEDNHPIWLEMIYGADRGFAPYGQRTFDQILQRSLDWICFLVHRKGCSQVIAACHTSSAVLTHAAKCGAVSGLELDDQGVRYCGILVTTMLASLVQGVLNACEKNFPKQDSCLQAPATDQAQPFCPGSGASTLHKPHTASVEPLGPMPAKARDNPERNDPERNDPERNDPERNNPGHDEPGHAISSNHPPVTAKTPKTTHAKIAILATPLSVQMGAASESLCQMGFRDCVHMLACPQLAPALESGNLGTSRHWAQFYLDKALDHLNHPASLQPSCQGSDKEASGTPLKTKVLVLGCTHYPLILPLVQIPGDVHVIDPGTLLAQRFLRGLVLSPHRSIDKPACHKQTSPTAKNPPTKFNRRPAPSSAHHRLIGSSVEWIGTTGQGDDAKLLRAQLEQTLFAPLIHQADFAGIPADQLVQSNVQSNA